MESSDWYEAKQLLAQALPLSAPERERLLNGACTNRAALRAEVRSLLVAHERAGELLETGVAIYTPAAAADMLIGQRLGPYLLVSVLGQGGMGVVYRARREAPAREVAIKVVRLGSEHGGRVRRFELEGRVLARLEHPHVARLFDVGRTPDGRSYFVLELVEGHTIDRHCADRRLPLRERLELFLKLCEALAYAHGRLVVHRDIKPGNVLVTPGGTPKLLDFGIAHLLDEGLLTGATETGLRLMTPAYASPEQMRGEPATVATDIHALGLMLHLLLTGRGAFQLTSGAPDELVRVVCLDDTPAPSVDLARPRTGGAGFEPIEPVPRLTRLLRGDLDSIVARALRKEPQARYASVDQLQADLRRYLDGEPVLARSGRWRYRAGKFVKRHRLPVALGTALLLALVGGLATTLWQARVARAERARAERRFADVRRLATSFLFDFHDAIRQLPGSTKARQLVVTKALGYLEGLSLEAGDDADLRFELALAYQRVGTVQGLPGQANLGDSTGAARSLNRAWTLLHNAEPRLHGRPEFVLAQVEIATDLGRTQRQLGQFESLRRLLEDAEQAAGVLPAGLAGAPLFAARVRLLSDLTIELERLGALEAAEQAARRQLQAAMEMRTRWPQDPMATRALGVAHRSLSVIQIHLGHYADARNNALAALALQRSVMRPEDTGSMRRLGQALQGLAKVECDGDWDHAEAAHAEALQIAEGLAAQDAANATAVQDVSAALGTWCWHLDRVGRQSKGRDVCAEALRLAERTADARDAYTSMNVVSARYFSGWQRELQGDLAGALQLYERALAAAAAPILADSGPELRSVEAEIWSAIGRARLELGQSHEAAAAAQRGLDRLGPLTNAARHDREELETRLLALVVWMRANLTLSRGERDVACAPLRTATTVATDLRALTGSLPRQPPVLAQLEELERRCPPLRARQPSS